MNISKKPTVLIFLILLLPSILFAADPIRNGYDLYHNIKRMDNPQNPDSIAEALYTTGYLAGYTDGLAIMQDSIFNLMFPSGQLSEKEIQKLSKELNLYRLNLPKEGMPTGQLILIYKKFAEKHPEELNGSARLCVFLSLVEAYGWK